jgi:hypothetical protein
LGIIPEILKSFGKGQNNATTESPSDRPKNIADLKRTEEQKKKSDERRPKVSDKSFGGQKRIEDAWENIDKLQDSGIIIYIDKFIQKYPNQNARTANFENLKELLKSKQFDFDRQKLHDIISIRGLALLYNEVKGIVLSNNPVNLDESLRNYIKKYLDSNVFRDKLLLGMVSQILADQFNYNGEINQDIDRIQPIIIQEIREKEVKKFGETLMQKQDQITIEYIDSISGYDFELLLKKLFETMGFLVTHTSFSKDQGADLVIEKDGVRSVIQAKNWTANVGNSGIQAAAAAIKHYNAHKAIVISSSGFTINAIELAHSNNVELWDRSRLSMILKENPIFLTEYQ